MIFPAAARTEVNPTTVWGVRYETTGNVEQMPERAARMNAGGHPGRTLVCREVTPWREADPAPPPAPRYEPVFTGFGY